MSAVGKGCMLESNGGGCCGRGNSSTGGGDSDKLGSTEILSRKGVI